VELPPNIATVGLWRQVRDALSGFLFGILWISRWLAEREIGIRMNSKIIFSEHLRQYETGASLVQTLSQNCVRQPLVMVVVINVRNSGRAVRNRRATLVLAGGLFSHESPIENPGVTSTWGSRPTMDRNLRRWELPTRVVEGRVRKIRIDRSTSRSLRQHDKSPTRSIGNAQGTS